MGVRTAFVKERGVLHLQSKSCCLKRLELLAGRIERQSSPELFNVLAGVRQGMLGVKKGTHVHRMLRN
jgi:hypothetical protein